jgi:hypothetical protein
MLPLCCLLASLLSAAPADWSPDLIHTPDAWRDRMNDALVRADGAGLAITVAPGRDWAIAAVPNVALPAGLAAVAVKVRRLSPGARWLVRVYGDVYGTGRPTTWGPFGGETALGLCLMPCDPRLLPAAGRSAMQVQLGLEGPAGSNVVFDGLEFQAAAPRAPAPAVPGQINLAVVDLMPNLPQPFKLLDWRAKAVDFDRLAFDTEAKGQYLPLCWRDGSRRDFDGPIFGLCSYVGDHRAGGRGQEGVTAMGAVLGATLVGLDKRQWVAMLPAFQSRRDPSALVLNTLGGRTGGSFWYEIFPGLMFAAIAERCPGAPGFDAIVRAGADAWAAAGAKLGGSETQAPNFDHTAFDFGKMKAVDNGQWREPDAAAGVAWIEYQAWRRWHDPKHLEAAEQALRFLDQRRDNPYYECLLPWGTLTAARLNAELGRGYNVDKLLNWCFGLSACRGGWGVTLGRWGDFDVAGLLGSVDNRGGYAFAMNTFAQAAALAPLPRYDPRYARAIGKWLLNLANNARLFYPGELPAECQSTPGWTGDPRHAIAYEGLRANWLGHTPCATGDPVAMKWGPETDLGIYGSAYVGLLGALVQPTDVPEIPAFDLLATDFGHGPADPTWLLYNPHAEARTVTVALPAGRCDLYDAVSDRILARDVAGHGAIELTGDRAVVLVARRRAAAD